MKALSQILALFLVGSNTLQIIVTIATVILLLSMLLSKVFGTTRRWIMKRNTSLIENNVWAIE